MKKNILCTLLVLVGLSVYAQEVQLPPAIVSAGGSSEEGSPNISRWRLSHVHVITLPDDVSVSADHLIQDDLDLGWRVSVYPNPVKDFLYIQFDLQQSEKFQIKLTDITGKHLLIQKENTFFPDQVFELDFSAYSPATFLLQIESLERKNRRAYPVQKFD